MKKQDQSFPDIRRSIVMILLVAVIAVIAAYLGMRANYAFLVIIGVLAAILLIRRQYLLLTSICLIFSIIPFSLNISGRTEIQVYYFCIPLLMWILLDNKTKFKTNKKANINFFFIFFLLIVIMNYLRNPGLPSVITGFSSDNHIQFSYLMGSLSLLCGYLITPFLFNSNREVRWIILFLSSFFTIGLFFSWLGYLVNFQSPFVPGYASTILTEDTSIGLITRYGWIGNYANFLLPISLVFIPNRYPLLKYACLGVLFISILFSGGRAQLIVFLISILLYFALEKGSVWPFVVGSLTLAVAYIIIFQTNLVTNTAQLNRFSLNYSEQELGSDLNGVSLSRFGVISLSLEMIKAQPLIGMGPGTLNEISDLRESYWNAAFYTAREGSHSTYFNIPAIYGVPALILYLIGLGKSLFKLFAAYKLARERKIYIFLLLIMANFLIMFIFGGNARGGNLYFYMTLGLIDVLVVQAAGSNSPISKDDMNFMSRL